MRFILSYLLYTHHLHVIVLYQIAFLMHLALPYLVFVFSVTFLTAAQEKLRKPQPSEGQSPYVTIMKDKTAIDHGQSDLEPLYNPIAQVLKTTDKFNLNRRPLIKDMNKIKLTCWPNRDVGDRCHMVCNCAAYPRVHCMQMYSACLNSCICMEME